MQYKDKQKLRSRTVNNNHNPVWHFSGHFKLDDEDEDDIMIRVYDDDIGKDDFLGEYSLRTRELRAAGEMTNKTVKLARCRSGQLVISCKFVPAARIQEKVGRLSLILHGASKLERKNKLKKADPYVVVTLGTDQDRLLD